MPIFKYLILLSIIVSTPFMAPRAVAGQDCSDTDVADLSHQTVIAAIYMSIYMQAKYDMAQATLESACPSVEVDYGLGLIHLFGLGVPRKPQIAIEYFKKSAKSEQELGPEDAPGHSLAMAFLGKLIEERGEDQGISGTAESYYTRAQAIRDQENLTKMATKLHQDANKLMSSRQEGHGRIAWTFLEMAAYYKDPLAIISLAMLDVQMDRIDESNKRLEQAIEILEEMLRDSGTVVEDYQADARMRGNKVSDLLTQTNYDLGYNLLFLPYPRIQAADVTDNRNRGFALMEQAANAGHVRAKLNLAKALGRNTDPEDRTPSIDQDPVRAYALLLEAMTLAEANYAKSPGPRNIVSLVLVQSEIAMKELCGLGTDIDLWHAYKQFKAVKQKADIAGYQLPGSKSGIAIYQKVMEFAEGNSAARQAITTKKKAKVKAMEFVHEKICKQGVQDFEWIVSFE